jgi:hypothetical protein
MRLREKAAQSRRNSLIYLANFHHTESTMIVYKPDGHWYGVCLVVTAGRTALADSFPEPSLLNLPRDKERMGQGNVLLTPCINHRN